MTGKPLEGEDDYLTYIQPVAKSQARRIQVRWRQCQFNFMKSENDFTSRKKYLEYLRDYYAGLAMQGLLSRRRGKLPNLEAFSTFLEVNTGTSVKLADALIAELYPNEK